MELRNLYELKLLFESAGFDSESIKRKIRALSKKQEIRPRPYGDGIYYKHIFKNARVEDVSEYCRANMWVNVASPFDCSGKWFTVRISCFQVGDNVVVYHFMGLDI